MNLNDENLDTIKKYSINKLTFVQTITEQEVSKVISKIAQKINEDYKGKQPCFLITMKGAIFFGVDLLRQIELPCTLDIISVKSYGEKMQNHPSDISIYYENLNLKGKDVILVEDIIDTGYTLEKLLKTLEQFQPKSISVASLVAKPEKYCVNVRIDYLGFSLPSNFIIGSGMDFNEQGRNLKGIYSLENLEK